ncbi:plus-3-domain-containing protein [Mycena belliarum]|uniref:Plus-3-domain-containing protein n=1 Tax=Mycena belliarum TaxID=1033014 RepID=A0AAD6TR46_9AGAR|nr:plus-3-domain-containing protein [Mycena belliae]
MSSELDDELLELVGGASSDKEKQTRKRSRDTSAPGKTKAKSSKKRKLAADSENDVESEDGSDEELYPLEGKYLNEEDREMLLGKTEIEREEILAARLDEVERIRDRKHVDKLRAQQLAGVAAVENDAVKRPARATGRDKTKDKTLSALKAKRKAKDEKKRTRGNSPKHAHERSSSPMDMEMSDSDSEDGQISKLDEEDERLFGKPKAAQPAVEQPLDCEHLQKIAVTRDMLVKHSTLPWFEKIVAGAWVRYLIGNEDEKPVYRICQIKSLGPASKPYKLTPDRTTNQVFELKHGKAEKFWQMDRASNTPWTLQEFDRLVGTHATEKVPMPTRKEVDERYAEMQELIAKPITETDISEMIARKRQSAALNTSGSGALSVVERSRLMAERTLAQRRQDFAQVATIDEKLAEYPEAAPVEVLEDRLARVNERNRKANLEAVRRSEVAEADRKRRERKARGEGAAAPAVFDPSARLRTVPRVFASATPTLSRAGTPNPAGLGVATSPTKGLSPSPVPKPVIANGKAFEAAIIDAIEVDLGDF